jgi:hypothetical protein
VLLVLCEAGTEFLSEEGFLAARFHVKGKPDDNHGKERSDLTEIEGGSEKREQNARIDGMTNRPVGTSANEFVPFFEGDDAAPIRAEMPARPKRDGDSRGGLENAKPFAEGAGRKKAGSEPSVERLLLIKQIKTGRERKRVSNALKDGFALLGFLAFERGHQPIGAKEKPKGFNPLAGRGETHIAASLAAALKMEQDTFHCKFDEETRTTHSDEHENPLDLA